MQPAGTRRSEEKASLLGEEVKSYGVSGTQESQEGRVQGVWNWCQRCTETFANSRYAKLNATSPRVWFLNTCVVGGGLAMFIVFPFPWSLTGLVPIVIGAPSTAGCICGCLCMKSEDPYLLQQDPYAYHQKDPSTLNSVHYERV